MTSPRDADRPDCPCICHDPSVALTFDGCGGCCPEPCEDCAAAWKAVPESADKTRGIFHAIHSTIDRLCFERDAAIADRNHFRAEVVRLREGLEKVRDNVMSPSLEANIIWLLSGKDAP